MQTEQQMPIFSRSFDLMVWQLQVTRHFPRMHRHDFTQRLLNACFDLRERLEIAKNIIRAACAGVIKQIINLKINVKLRNEHDKIA